MAKSIKKPTKKAQNGVVVSQDKKGNYIYTKKVNTKDGPRYYQGKSLDREMAETIANFKKRAKPQDSTRKADLLPFEIKRMDEEKKKGGVIKKMQAGGKATPDSTAYFKKRESDSYTSAARNIKDPKLSGQAFKSALEAGKSVDRQSKKGKPGYDKNGYPLKKQKMGGVIKKTTKPVAKKVVKLIKKKK